jgi:hypothetical protein
MNNFRLWLFSQDQRKDAVGDLARDARADYKTRQSNERPYPKPCTPATFRAYLLALGIRGPALRALDEATAEWQTTRR